MDNLDIVVGNQEWCELPQLGVFAIKARVDSGAATSSIHAYQIEAFEKEGDEWIKYELHPLIEREQIILFCESKVFSKRKIKSSNGEVERRYVVETLLKLGSIERKVQITLTNRDEMGFRMLLGRQAMGEDVLISPSKEFLLGQKEMEALEILYLGKSGKVGLFEFIKRLFKK